MITDAQVLEALTIYCKQHMESMQHWENDVGLSCDELGCAICNADSDEDAAQTWLHYWKENEWPLPFDLEDIAEYLET